MTTFWSVDELRAHEGRRLDSTPELPVQGDAEPAAGALVRGVATAGAALPLLLELEGYAPARASGIDCARVLGELPAGAPVRAHGALVRADGAADEVEVSVEVVLTDRDGRTAFVVELTAELVPLAGVRRRVLVGAR